MRTLIIAAGRGLTKGGSRNNLGTEGYFVLRRNATAEDAKDAEEKLIKPTLLWGVKLMMSLGVLLWE